MRKFHLLLTLIVALAVTACSEAADPIATAETQQATAQPAVSHTPPATVITAEQDPAAPDVQVSTPAATQAPTVTDAPEAVVLPVIGPAPGWDNSVWINTETPLPLDELRGKVVLLEFWTFG